VDIGDYRKLSFFMKTDTAPDSLTLSLRNPAGEGLSVSFSPPAHSDWRKYTWELDSGGASTVTMEGEEISSSGGDYSNLERNRRAAGVNRIDISRNTSSADSGTIHIDEFFFHEPVLEVGGAGRSQLSYYHPGVLLGTEERPWIYELSYENQLQLQSRNFASGFLEPAAGELSFSNELGFGLLAAQVQLSYSGFLDRSDFYPTGGYAISLPLIGSRIRLSDEYRESHSYSGIDVDHSSSASFTVQELLSIQLGAELSKDTLRLEREWSSSGTLELLEETKISLDTSFAAENSENEDEIFPTESFGKRYGGSFVFYVPYYTEGRISRATSHSFEIAGGISNTRLKLFTELNTATDAANEDFSLNESHSIGVSSTTALAPQTSADPSLTLTYRRSLQTEDAHGEELGFFDDIGQAAARAGDQVYFWNSLPFGEIWRDAEREEFIEESFELASARYNPSFSSEFSLTPGSRLYHLIAPANVSFEISRNLERSFDSSTDSLQIDSSYRATALNLFGRLGRYGGLSWYRSEEISHSVGYSSTIPLSSTMSRRSESHRIDLGQFLEFQINRGNSLTTDTSYSYGLPDRNRELEILTAWQRRRPFEKDFPFKERIGPKEQPSLAHEETLEFAWEHRPIEETTRYRGLIAHTTRLIIGEKGETKAFIRMGYERSEVGDELGSFVLQSIGGELGFEVKLSF